MRKIIYIVLDGLGDEPVEELDGKTPLEAAATPSLDRLAQQGSTGMVHTFSEGIAPESDIAVISLLGYDPTRYYTGRGPLEAFSEGMTVNDGNCAVRANFATVQADAKTITDRRVARSLSTEEAAGLAKEISAKVTLSSATFEFKSTVGHRAILVIRGVRSKLSGWISNTDPAYERSGMFGIARENYPMLVIPSEPLSAYADSPEAKEAANLINEFTLKTHAVLEESAINKKRIEQGKLSANLILCRSAGDCLPQFPKVTDLYHMKFGCFVEMPVERGIALLTGMEIIAVPSATGHLDVDYPVWAKVALNSLSAYDGLYVHIKGPDEAGHDGNALKKKEIIEAIDRFFFAPLLAEPEAKDCVICVTSDLSTVSAIKAHSSIPVPLLVCGGAVTPDGSLSFSEKACQRGSLGERNGQDIMPLLVKAAQG